jgi:hypothetical protein
MVTILFLAVGSIMLLVLVLFAVVVAAIKQESQVEELATQPPNAITAWVRRLLGVYVRKPDGPYPRRRSRRTVSYRMGSAPLAKGPAE